MHVKKLDISCIWVDPDGCISIYVCMYEGKGDNLKQVQYREWRLGRNPPFALYTEISLGIYQASTSFWRTLIYDFVVGRGKAIRIL